MESTVNLLRLNDAGAARSNCPSLCFDVSKIIFVVHFASQRARFGRLSSRTESATLRVGIGFE